jgi:hypothetical protein
MPTIDKAAIISRLRGAIVAVEHNDHKAAEELVTGVLEDVVRGRDYDARQALLRGMDRETGRTLAEVRALAMGEAVDADSVECDGRSLR